VHARDVWTGEESTIDDMLYSVTKLGKHDSKFVVFTPA
jgi:hypothetical protein